MAPSSVIPVTVLAGFDETAPTVLAGFDETAPSDPRVRTVRASSTTGESIFAADRLAPRSGCLCCSVADDLVRALRELHALRLERRTEPFERVVVLAPGEADLRPVLAALAELPLVAARYAPASIVVVVASETQVAHDAGRAQVAMADRVIVREARWVAEVAGVNPGAPVDVLAHGLPAGWLDTGAYRGSPPRLVAPPLAAASAYRPVGQGAPGRIATSAWSATEPFASGRLESALESVVRIAGERLLRMKGVAWIEGEEAPRAVHAAGHTLYPSARLPLPAGPDRTSRIVFAGRDLEEARVASILDSFLRR